MAEDQLPPRLNQKQESVYPKAGNQDSLNGLVSKALMKGEKLSLMYKFFLKGDSFFEQELIDSHLRRPCF